MGSIAQNICERYLKHIIDLYYVPDNEEDINRKERVLKAHSLRRLINFINRETDMQVDDETIMALRKIDGLYYSTRYPGDDSIEVDANDIEDCYDAINITREYVVNTVAAQEREIDEEYNQQNTNYYDDDEWER